MAGPFCLITTLGSQVVPVDPDAGGGTPRA
jgi:hypothetical protein